MSNTATNSSVAPWRLWVVAGPVAAWNAFGAFDFTATVTRFEPYMSSFPQELQQYWYAFPIWMFVIWGVAVWGGLAGAILTLLRRRLAVPVLGVSLVCAIASMGIGFTQPAPEGANDPIFAGVIIAVAAAFFAYVVWLNRQGVLR